ncbi:hypothetical protein GYMLUDRAFT_1003603 [Collybiopsis luxurians FD-317 M1]|uniref:Rab-GAP TBC domain-containing protein n=1 Tax=Collybiopsis luxurians FD-317 M1 TaxID=944289 RepID=A0A0D0CMF2_9AGAR|nr:hypothetical protein GYMLUDRAFT_1003603 [Collybiopsis luxurians FD-317 M1]
MAPPLWEITSVKAQLRLTSQRLGHLQEKNDSKGSIIRRDIATLLQQGNVGLARVKAQNLYQEDVLGDVLEILEMHVGVILEHISELEYNPAVIEAVSSIIFASPRVESKELQVVRELLVQRLGPDFTRASVGNKDQLVSDRIVNNLSAPPPNAVQLDAYLRNIATAYGVEWHPDPPRQDIVGPLSEILDEQSSPIVDVAGLRRLCARGIPDEPACLRPRIWRVLLGTLPVLKASWPREVGKQRESYYDLVRRLLEPFSDLPEPNSSLSSLDVSLLKVSKQLSGIPSDLFSGLEEEPAMSNICPFDDSAPDNIKIPFADNLSNRLRIIQKSRQLETPPSIPEIRLESSDVQDEVSGISATESASVSSSSTILHASEAFDAPHAHKKHTSALLRMLYVHGTVNPGNLSPHIPALLLPLYSVLNREGDPEDLAHVEADTFWLFEAMIGEFAELEDEDSGNLWMRKFSERLNWADTELRDNLFAKGLDPALPHYSYRWLAPLLTQTIPLASVIVTWDALFACPMRDRQNFKLDFLVDICTAMIIRAKAALLRLGKSGPKSPGLWSDEAEQVPLSPLRPWELSDAFVQGMALLQHYPIDAAGGIDSILQTASELRNRREDEAKLTATNPLTLGDRLRLSVWKGFTNQPASPDRSPSPSELSDEEDTSGNDTETQDTGLTSRLATTVWRGITNQTAMEPPPSPLSPSTPSPPSAQSSLVSPAIVVNDDIGGEVDTEANLTSRLAATVWKGITNRTAMEPPPSPLSPAPAPDSSHSVPHTPMSPSIVVTDSGPTSNSASRGWSSSASLWGYAERLKESNAAATLSKVSSNWQAKALVSSWGLRKSDATKEQPHSADTIRHSDPLQGFKPSELRRTSVPVADRSGLYSPPARPAFFKPPRDTMMFSGKEPIIDTPSSPESSESGGIIQKTRNLQASFAALTRGSEPTPLVTPQPKVKSGPRPLLLGSTSVTTPRSDRPISRSENSTPLDKRGISRQWNDVMHHRNQHTLNRDSLSSVSSLSPSDALTRGKPDYDSDSPAPVSRKVALNRRSVSPMAPQTLRTGSIPVSSKVPAVPHLRSGSTPHLSMSSSSSSSSGVAALTSPVVMSPLDFARGPKSPGWGQVRIPDSPPVADDPAPARSPVDGPIVSEEHSLEKSSSVEEPALGAPSQSRKLTRKRTPPPGDTSDSAPELLPKRSTRVRTKRNGRPPNLRLQPSQPAMLPERINTSPGSLAVEWPQDEQELATTPKASSFDTNSASSPRSPRRSRKVSTESPRQRKASGEGQESRQRKVSTEGRTRKISDAKAKRHRDSGADMGDDEGYDELLSAYESEDSARPISSDA